MVYDILQFVCGCDTAWSVVTASICKGLCPIVHVRLNLSVKIRPSSDGPSMDSTRVLLTTCGVVEVCERLMPLESLALSN